MAPPSLGTEIRRARQRLRWTQEYLAGKVGVAVRTVNDWENDRTAPRNRMPVLEDVLGVSLSGDPEPRYRPIPPRLRREIADILPDSEDQARVIGLLEGTLEWPADPPERGEDESQRAG